MEAVGTVVEVFGNRAKVVSKRVSSCASCSSCEAKGVCHAELIFGDQSGEISVDAVNKVGAKKGDRVELVSDTSKTLVLSALIFVVPLVISVLLYFLFDVFINNTGILALLLVLSFVLAFFVISKIINVFLSKNDTVIITKILGDEDI